MTPYDRAAARIENFAIPDAILDMLPDRPPTEIATFEEVTHAVSIITNLDIPTLLNPGGKGIANRHAVFPRQLLSFLLYRDARDRQRPRFPRSTPVIARYLGQKDHTTVMHSIEKITRLAKRDPEVRTMIRCARALYHPEKLPEQTFAEIKEATRRKPDVPPDEIFLAIEMALGFSKRDLLYRNVPGMNLARQATQYLLREDTHLNAQEVGDVFGINYTTIIRNCDKIAAGMRSEKPYIRTLIERVRMFYAQDGNPAGRRSLENDLTAILRRIGEKRDILSRLNPVRCGRKNPPFSWEFSIATHIAHREFEYPIPLIIREFGFTDQAYVRLARKKVRQVDAVIKRSVNFCVVLRSLLAEIRATLLF